jgi:hypothetical protein
MMQNALPNKRRTVQHDVCSEALPRLGPSELAAVFGEDSAARRRHNALAALLHEGRTQRSAAQAHGMADRTLRNALQAFRCRGLLGLRSRRRGKSPAAGRGA